MQKILNLIGQYRSRENEARFRCYAATRKLTNTPAVFLSLSGSWFILIKHTESISHRGCSVKKGVFLEILQNSQENACARDSFLIKLHGWNFIKKEPLAQVFPLNFAKFLRTPLLQNTPDGCF